jgi:hypothetical protein
MAKINLSYVVALIAGGVVAMSLRYFTDSAESIQIRKETFAQQQAADTFQVELINKREQIRLQQDGLSKGSAISDTVGPAVIADIKALAERNKNQRLRDLLERRAPKDAPEKNLETMPGIEAGKKGER